MVKFYNLEPARGQALLKFKGRLFPSKIELFDFKLVERIVAKNPPPPDLLFQADCLAACAYLKSKNISVDLVYIDPPFASGANYAKTIYLRNGNKDVLENEDALGEEIMYSDIWQKEDYLNWLHERLLAIRSVMSETASIYVHLDWHIGHYVKILLDEIFGEDNFRNEIIWRRKKGSSTASTLSNCHDMIYFYTKSSTFNYEKQYIPYSNDYIKKHYTKKDKRGIYRLHDLVASPNLGGNSPKYTYKGFTPKTRWLIKKDTLVKLDKNNEVVWGRSGVPRRKLYLKDRAGVPLQDIWLDINNVQSSKENTNYPTQKPEALLERIIKASSKAGDIVADFFAGSGTTVRVAHRLNRRFIASDIGLNALQTTRDELVRQHANFDVYRIKIGLQLFRNPSKTVEQLFNHIAGFKSQAELGIDEFWKGGIPKQDGSYAWVKFTGLNKKLTKELLDVYFLKIYNLYEKSKPTTIWIIYAYKDLDVDQAYIDKTNKIKEIAIKLIALDNLLAEKKDLFFTPDNAQIIITQQGTQYQVQIKNFYSPYLKKKLDLYNDKKIGNKKPIKLSSNGLELIESVQFDTELGEVWRSNPALEDKARKNEKIKGVYILTTKNFKIKIRNIAGDEIIIESKDVK